MGGLALLLGSWPGFPRTEAQLFLLSPAAGFHLEPSLDADLRH